MTWRILGLSIKADNVWPRMHLDRDVCSSFEDAHGLSGAPVWHWRGADLAAVQGKLDGKIIAINEVDAHTTYRIPSQYTQLSGRAKPRQVLHSEPCVYMRSQNAAGIFRYERQNSA